MLWLALSFPLLPLEALPLRRSPSVIAARGRVLACDAAADGAGVAVGQRLSTALGLQPGLAVFERDAGREARALDALACWAGTFTPTVSPLPPAGLLLEIGGCLRLFGGVPAIVEAVLAGCREQAYTAGWSVAPTPLGALWLAGAGAAQVCLALPDLHAALAALPCSAPGWPDELLARLESFGLCCLGDLLSLPIAGLRQRIGSGPVDEWLRARGDLPDPRRAFVFPERFSLALELPSRVEQAEALVFAGQRLLSALSGWLNGRQLLVRACTLWLGHDDGSSSPLVLHPGEACADEMRLLRLLREHLARMQLAAPVEALRLVADEVQSLSGDSRGLFARAAVGEGVAACLERLRARLGESAVQGLAVRADHRPECATVDAAIRPDLAVAAASTADGGNSRPLWLLPEPRPLAERDGRPHWHGPLQLLTRSERLESGWWDAGEAGAAGDLRRDYFVARDRQGQWAWIFRDAHGWFLHGLFA